ncbi:MAG: hypothetical protein U0746_17585 [Gemmataceae bacterium]
MTETTLDLVQQLQARERARLAAATPPAPSEPPSIPYAELADPVPGSPIATEWNFYRRVVGRLLTAGHEGKWVLIKGEEIIGIWDRPEDADRVRLERYPMQPVLMKPILSREPVLRGGGRLRFSPGGSAVGSQGRQPLESRYIDTSSPGGAAVCRPPGLTHPH